MRYGDVQVLQQLGINGHLEEAVEVLAMGEAEEVTALAPRQGNREHDGVQQQVHQLLTLKGK